MYMYLYEKGEEGQEGGREGGRGKKRKGCFTTQSNAVFFSVEHIRSHRLAVEVHDNFTTLAVSVVHPQLVHDSRDTEEISNR